MLVRRTELSSMHCLGRLFTVKGGAGMFGKIVVGRICRIAAWTGNLWGST